MSAITKNASLALLSCVFFLLPAAVFANGKKEPAKPAVSSVSIVDVTGRTVTLPKPAVKVVGTHNPTLNQLIILGGGGKYIAGFGNKNMAGNLYAIVYPELKDDVPQIGMGRNVNYEQCLAVGTELALLPERFADIAPQFEQVGIPAAVVLPNSESFDTIRESLMRVAVLIGEAERAQKIIDFFNAKVANAASIAQKSGYHPKALYTGGSSALTVANGIMLQSMIIETAGGVNVAKDVKGAGDFINVTLEEIIAWNPDVIYIPTFASYTVESILTNPAWASISAVKNKKVFRYPSLLEPWDYPTPSCAMGLSWLVHNLNPSLYTLDQVLKDANEYYSLVYGKTFTASQLGIAE
jgi:iron complex transport system substrate-binding protein